MARRGLSSTIGDALLTVVELAWPKVTTRVDELIERVAEVARPHPPMTLRTLDGEVLTGLVCLDRGAAILFLGVREPGSSAPMSPPWPRPPPDDGMPPWARDVDPYRR